MLKFNLVIYHIYCIRALTIHHCPHQCFQLSATLFNTHLCLEENQEIHVLSNKAGHFVWMKDTTVYWKKVLMHAN